MPTMKYPPPLDFEFPLPRPLCGVALGNGAVGALVWGADELRLTVSRNDHWDHRHGVVYPEGITYRDLVALHDPEQPAKLKGAIMSHIDQPPFAPSMLPGGRFDLRLARGLRPRRARLHYDNGRLEVFLESDAGATGSVCFQLSPESDILMLDDPEGCVEVLTAHPAWEWVGGARPAGEYPGMSLSGRGLPSPEVFADAQKTGWFQPVVEDPGFHAAAMRREGGRLFSVLLAPDASSGAARAEAARLAVERQGAEAFSMSCRRWWERYWEGVPALTIPEEFFQRFYHYAQYKFACAANPHARRPATLQGPWFAEDRIPPWAGNYTVNVNIQQIYTLAFASGNVEFMLPLFDMLGAEEFRQVMRQNARRMVGVDDGLLLTHSVDDRGRQCQAGLRPHSTLDQAVTGWLAQLYWLYYRHTLDEVFLRERAWPFMTGVMRVYEAMLEKRGARLSLPLGASPEFGAYNHQSEAGRDSSWQLACIHMLADALLAAADILRLPARKAWRDIRARLPKYSLVPVPPPAWSEPGDYGKRIGLWENQDLPESYRHHAHLGGIYPFDSLGEPTAEERQILENTLDHWTSKSIGEWSEWGVPWAAIIQSRTGFAEAPLILMRVWRELFVNEGLATVYIPRFPGISAHRRADQKRPKADCEIMQLDGTMAAATALIEMLVHTRAGTVHVFPAVSPHWADAEFAEVRVPGAFLVGARRRGGRTADIEVRSLQGGRIRLAVSDRPTMRLRRRGNPAAEVRFPLELELSPGETIRLEVVDSQS